MKKKKQLKDNRGCLQKYLNGQSGQFTVRAKGKQNLKALKKFHCRITFATCTDQSHLLKIGCNRLKLVSKVDAVS